MNTPKPRVRCRDIADNMVDILDGTAHADLYAHLSECGACRDARRGARQAATLVKYAGADYEQPKDLKARVLSEFRRRQSVGAEADSDSFFDRPTPQIGSLSAPEPFAEGSEPDRALLEEALELEEDARPTEPAPPTTAKMEAKPKPPKRATPKPPTRAQPKRSDPAASPPIGLSAYPATSKLPEARPRRGVDIRSVALKKRILFAGLLGGALAAAAAIALVVRWKAPGVAERGHGADGFGTVVTVATNGSAPGLSVCNEQGISCRALRSDEALTAGLLVTDAQTRARVKLADGSEVILDRGTRLLLASERPRRAMLQAGGLVAEIVKRPGERARFDLPQGWLEVISTKFSLRVSREVSTVDVSRGTVELSPQRGKKVVVSAGQQGRLFVGLPPTVGPARLEALSWSEIEPRDREALRGLGEVGIEKPGASDELFTKATLTSHKLQVRVVGGIARTEVKETFVNRSGAELDAIYRFPIPQGAELDRLALELDGKLVEGEFAEASGLPPRRDGTTADVGRRAEVWSPDGKDEALLEWKRAGRLEFSLGSLAKQATAKVVVSYTQVLKAQGGFRRYTYPLPNELESATRLASFEVDATVTEYDPTVGVASPGYSFKRSTGGDVAELKLRERDFVPQGDLFFEFALPERKKVQSAWVYRPSEPAAVAGGKGYVALALRPDFEPPAAKGRIVALAVDSSRSMYGETYRRAAEVAETIIRELDPEDRFTLLSCDTQCRILPGGAQKPGRKAAERARRFLEGISPEGASDVLAAVRLAFAVAKKAHFGREVRVLYVGDGRPTAGPVLPRFVTREVEVALPGGAGAVSAVAVGPLADTRMLAALCRAGGGVMLPFGPGQGATEVGYRVLGALYSPVLREVSVELPEGLVEVAPEQIDNIPYGSEGLVFARLKKDEVKGDVVLRGKLGQKSYERRISLELKAGQKTTSASVGSLFAARRIKDLERLDERADKKEAILLSSKFGVASRYTSLFVGKKPAILDTVLALERQSSDAEPLPVWTPARLVWKRAREPRQAATQAAAPKAADASLVSEPQADDGQRTKLENPYLDDPADDEGSSGPGAGDASVQGYGESPERYKSWQRQGEIDPDRKQPSVVTEDVLNQAIRRLEEHPNRPDVLKNMYVLRALTSQLDAAQKLAERWSAREPFGPEPLIARADLAARYGDRELAIRILGGVVDASPRDVGAQTRLFNLHRRAGQRELGCRHLMALAQLEMDDASILAQAASCAQRTGQTWFFDELFRAAKPWVTPVAKARISAFEDDADKHSGDLRVRASWDGKGHDLDLALLRPDGYRASWLGAPTGSVNATNVLSTAEEGLSLSGAKPGEYLIEIVRSAGSGPVKGELFVTAPANRRKIPFVLEGTSKIVGLVRISTKPYLLPVRPGP